MIRRIPHEQLAPAATRSLQAHSLYRRLPPPTQAAPVHSDAAVRALGAALRALLSEELALKPEHIRAVVERELSRVRRARNIELHVHPDDAAWLEQEAQYRERLELEGSVQLVRDASITRGGCVVRSESGELDARIETRLEAALELLRQGALGA